MRHYAIQIRKAAAVYSVGEIALTLSNFAAGIVFARILTVSSFGRFEILYASVVVVSTAAAQWLAQGTLRFLPGSIHTDDESSWRASIRLACEGLQLPLMAVVFAVVSVATWRIMHFQVVLALAGGMLAVTYGIWYPLLSVRQAEGSASEYSLFRSVLGLGGFVLATLSLVVWHTVLSVIVSYALVTGLASIVMWGRIFDLKPAIPFRAALRSTQVRQLAQYGWPFTLWFACFAGLNVADRIMLGMILDESAVGVYGANYRLIVGGVTLLGAPLATAAHPIIMAAWDSGDRLAARRLGRRLCALVAGVGVCIVFVAMTIGTRLVAVVLGNSYVASAGLVGTIAAAGVLWQMGIYSHKVLEAQKSTRLLAFLGLCALTVNVVGNAVMIPTLGLLGAALASVLGYGVYVGATLYFGRQPVQRDAAATTV